MIVQPGSPNRQIRLVRRPADQLRVDDLAPVEGTVPEPGDGEALVRTILLSIDPANRSWIGGRTYRDQIREGDVMAGFTICEVVDPNGTNLAAGTIVVGEAGWQQFAALPARRLRPISATRPLSHHLGVLGVTGLTAYIGLTKIGTPAAGEVLVVSAAAGATGSVVGQVGRLLGMRTVGIVGSEAKRRFVTEELRFDAAVSYRSPTFADDLREACPSGIDVYFDNVGGPVLDLAIRRLNLHGRVVCCGAISLYDTAEPPPSPRGIPGLVITKRLRIEGFLLGDHAREFDAAVDVLQRWIEQGELRVVEEIIDGLDAAPQALVGLLAGENVGKRLVRVGPDRA
jgi:NADPH-dependent curcumin reductase CurA